MHTLLARHRLVTLTGPGGTGKTRLALRVAAARVNLYADGVWVVQMARLQEPAQVAQAIAAFFGLRAEPQGRVEDTLIAQLRPRHLLLVLDNCEHLVDAVALLAGALLQSCPRLAILATSREVISVEGETVARVPPLALRPPATTDATAPASEPEGLFVARASAVHPEFVRTPHNRASIAAICEHLDGLPLPIELAAARVRMLTVQQIAERLDDRFRLLTGGTRTALPHHATLQALLDWSYDLLDGGEQALLRRLATFRGGWTLDAAETVCVGAPVGEVLRCLTGLVDKSLVQVEQHGETLRYRLLETLRHYAVDKLLAAGEDDAWRRRHAAYFLAYADAQGLAGVISSPDEWTSRMERELDNLRAALEWSLGARADAETALRLVQHVAAVLFSRGFLIDEARLLDAALQHPGATDVPALQVEVAVNLASVQMQLDQYATAQALFDRAVLVAESRGMMAELANALYAAGLLARERGDVPAARDQLERSLALYRPLGAAADTAGVLITLAGVASCKTSRIWRNGCCATWWSLTPSTRTLRAAAGIWNIRGT